jgi:tetratricopeptide (TPR) repeat protein
MGVKRLLNGRFQFIRVVSSKQYSKSYLMVDCDDPLRAKCIVKHLQLPTRNPVTLKILIGLLNKRIELLNQLGQQDAVAETLASFQENQDYYWIRPYIPGHSLQEELANQKPWSEKQVIQFLQRVLVILEYLQRKNIVHQNLHPGNIIRRKSSGQLVLVDFGLAQDSSQFQLPTQNAEINGKPTSLTQADSYVDSPYLQHQRHSSFNIDHFSLGMIAFQGSTGLVTEALPSLNRSDFLEEVKLQLDECSQLSQPLKELIIGMVNPQPAANFRRAHDILMQLRDLTLSKPPLGKKQKISSPKSSSQQTSASPERPGTKMALMLVGFLLLFMSCLAILLWLKVPSRVRTMQLSQRAQQSYQAGQLEEASNHIDRAISLWPHRGDLFAQRAEINWELANSDAALQDLTQAIQIEPENPVWYFKRGNLRFYLGDLQGAIADYTNALKFDSGYGDAYVNRGSARAERGDEAGAVEDYSAAIPLLEETDKQASAYLNRCLSLSNLGDQAAALDDCTTAINLSPNSSLAYENRGLVKRQLNDLEGALRDFSIAIQIDPGSAEPYYNRGLARADLGDLEGAREDFQQTITLNPEHPFVYYDRGLIYTKQGEFEKAVTDFEKAANFCLDVGRLGCFEDAQYQIQKIQSLK